MIKQMLHIHEIARVQGLMPLCEEGRRLAQSDWYLDKFLALELNEEALLGDSLCAMLREYDSFQGNILEH